MHLHNNIALKDGLVGGILLGISSSGYMFLTGRITGISGIVENVLASEKDDDQDWPLSYLLGLISSGCVVAKFIPQAFGSKTEVLALTPTSIAVAGILTGFGTRMGSGCTSGHGLCGLARLSMRSLTAVCTFMTTGAITAYVTRNTSLNSIVYSTSTAQSITVWPAVGSIFAGALLFRGGKIFDAFKLGTRTLVKKITNNIVSFGSAFLFGIGLGVSGMCNPSRVLHFLDFSGKDGWDYTLAGVMGGGVLVNLLGFNFLKSTELTAPLCSKSSKFSDSIKVGHCIENTTINWKLLLGSAVFGMGWGLAGVCPGPALVTLGGNVDTAKLFVPSMVAGIVAHELAFGKGLNKTKKQ